MSITFKQPKPKIIRKSASDAKLVIYSKKPQVNMYPSAEVINILREFIRSGLYTQKSIGEAANVSQTRMSQYMNNNKRQNGWKKTNTALGAFIAENYHKLNRHDFELNSIMDSELPPQPSMVSPPTMQNVYKLNAEMIGALTTQHMDTAPQQAATFEQSVVCGQPVAAIVTAWYHTQTTYSQSSWDYYVDSQFSIHDTQLFDNY
ncbi:Hypothetical protein FSTVST1_218 [Faustovirus ST1]|nr:Hypothetical protein FSTVST1_218 [Faustovirus ST1]